MSKLILKKSREFSAASFILAAAVLLSLVFIHPSRSANPTNGMLNPTGSPVAWVGTATGGAALDDTTCVDGATCDTFLLTLTGQPSDWVGRKARVVITWPNTLGQTDYDLFVRKGNSTSGPLVGSSAQSGGGPETVDIDPNQAGVGTGMFTVRVVYFSVVPGTDQYSGNASAIAGGAVPTPTPSPGSTPTPTPQPPGTPRYQNFVAPVGFGEDAGEPSIGSNWLSENVKRDPNMTFTNTFINGSVIPVPNGGTATYYGGFLTDMLRTTFDDCSSPATALWEKKPLLLAATPRALGDPILFTDHGYPSIPGTGRTLVAQEEAQAGATVDATDNDGDMFIPTQGAGAPAGVDHETIGAGPYHTPIPPTKMFGSAFYYAAQSVSDARISRSDDGGVSYGPAVPMYTTANCGGLHGHVKVGPDGTVYVPNNACGGTADPVGHADGEQAAIVSEDNGLTFSIRQIPGTTTKSDRDPSIGIATDGTIYFGMQSADGHARISVSHDKGVNWVTFPGQVQPKAYDVGAQLGIQNMVFAEVVAGDPNRASFAFFGTTTGGTNYSAPEFPGVWYLYIASTFDGGQSWTTVNVTPNDPIQRGGICGSGNCRNLLDFFDATIDKEGRVLIGGEDGCIGACVNGGANSFTAKAFITRQSGGKRMFATYDPVEPTFPGAPAVTGSASGSVVQLSWPEPDAGGSPITGYNIYRGTGNTFALLATVNVPTYTDPNFTAGQSYRVTALNKSGAGNTTMEGPYCHNFTPGSGPVASACKLPGIQVANDVSATGADNDSGQNTPVDGSVNIKQLYIAEPFVSTAKSDFYFTLQVAPSNTGSAPPNSQWFILWNRQGTDSNDPADASYDRMYVAMRTDAAGTPTFEYGKWGVPIDTSGNGVPNPNSNTPKKIGAADSGSYDPLTGVIRIVVSKSKYQAIDGGSAKYGPGSDLAATNVRTYFNRPDPGQRSQNNASDISDNGNYSIVGNNSCAPQVQLLSAVSRLTHGSGAAAVDRDISLIPNTPNSGTEPRRGGAGGSYQIVMRFGSPVTFSSAQTSAGSINGTPVVNGNIVTVNLTGVPDQQTTTVTLNGVTAGAAASTVAVNLPVLIGDTTNDGAVNSGDALTARNTSGQLVDQESVNFRTDFNRDGVVNSGDAFIVRQNSGHPSTSTSRSNE